MDLGNSSAEGEHAAVVDDVVIDELVVRILLCLWCFILHKMSASFMKGSDAVDGGPPPLKNVKSERFSCRVWDNILVVGV